MIYQLNIVTFWHVVLDLTSAPWSCLVTQYVREFDETVLRFCGDVLPRQCRPRNSSSNDRLIVGGGGNAAWLTRRMHWFEGRHVPHHINHSLGCRVVTRVLTSPSFCPPQINYLIIICGTFNDWCGDLTFDMTEIWLMLLTKSDKFMCCGRPGGTLLLAPGAPRSNDLAITSKIRDSSQLQIT